MATPEIEAALFNVESIHHIHGQECLCGFKSAVSRERTKHIVEAVLEALSPLVAALAGQLDAADRQIAARSGETSAERLWRDRAETAERVVDAQKSDIARLTRDRDDWESNATDALTRAEDAETVIRHILAARDEFDKNGSLAFLQMELDRALDGGA